MIVVAVFAKIVIMIMQPLFDQNDDSCFYEDYKAIIDDLIEKKKRKLLNNVLIWEKDATVVGSGIIKFL